MAVAKFDKDGKNIYTKICRGCHKTFESTSRRQAYHNSDCCRKHALKKKSRRKQYNGDDHDLELLIRKAYLLSVQIANHCLADEKAELIKSLKEGETVELNHLNMNVFDVRPENLHWMIKSRHEEFHSHLPSNDNLKRIKEYMSRNVSLRLQEKEGFVSNILSQPRYSARTQESAPILDK